MNPDLQNARINSILTKNEIELITNLIDGNEEITQQRRMIQERVNNTPVLSNEDNYTMSRIIRYKKSIEKMKCLIELRNELRDKNGEKIDFDIFFDCLSDDLAPILHTLMFIPNIEALCTEEQKAYWLPKCMSMEVTGSYGQTELGHGSNVRALETTATFIPSTDEFEIHTPTETAYKWLPGSLGLTCNHSMIIARLIIGDKDYGIHNFIVPLRDVRTHELLPGVTTGDIGPKIGYNAMDNGFAKFDHVRIPRLNMAMKYTKVSRDGKYTKSSSPNKKIAYITMQLVRAIIVKYAGRNLAKACTIGLRYAHVRRQGYKENEKDGEYQLIDYPIHQYRIITLLATSYAFFFAGKRTFDMFNNLKNKILNNDPNAGQLMTEVHSTSSALKSLTTKICADGIEDIRKCCGGHGYLKWSGLVELETTYLQNPTVEGDNYLLTQQIASLLLKILNDINDHERSERAVGDCSYLNRLDAILQNTTVNDPLNDFNDISFITRAFHKRAIHLLIQFGNQMKYKIFEKNLTPHQAWIESLVIISKVSFAHAHAVIMNIFYESIRVKFPTEEIGYTMNLLARLHGLYWMDKELGEFLECEALKPKHVKILREQIDILLIELKPRCIALTDAWDFSDFQLRSVIGRYDGNVYPALIDQATRLNPMNNPEAKWDQNPFNDLKAKL